MKLREFETVEGAYTFKAEDDWGDYYKGKYRKGSKHTRGYQVHWYNCTDGERHRQFEHIMKWEYFNGEVPEGYEIDHIIPIMNGGTNKLSNLRCVTHRENCNNENSFMNKSKSHKGKTPWNKGIPWSENDKKKISDSKEKYKKRIDQIDAKTGEILHQWESSHQIERELGYGRININRCCDGGFYNKSRGKWVNVTQAYGYIWKKSSHK